MNDDRDYVPTQASQHNSEHDGSVHAPHGTTGKRIGTSEGKSGYTRIEWHSLNPESTLSAFSLPDNSKPRRWTKAWGKDVLPMMNIR
jgi:hypothetical protein